MATASCYGRVFNIGSDREVSISELADRVIEAAGDRQAAKRFVSYTTAYGAAFEEPIRRVPDLRAIRAAIGFEQQYTLEDTLAELVERERAGRVDPVLAKKAV
jgi:UDP-glucose 4-epimerase